MSLTPRYLNQRFLLRDLDYSNCRDAFELPRHSGYALKEAFSPAFVKHAAAAAGCKKGDTLLDPFCGSGTVPLAAVELGLRATGFEVNPFLGFVSQTKLRKCSGRLFRRGIDRALKWAENGQESPLENFSTFGRSAGRGKWLFNQSVLRASSGALHSVGNIDPQIG